VAVNGDGVYEGVEKTTGGIMITPLLIYIMHGRIDIGKNGKCLGALHGRKG